MVSVITVRIQFRGLFSSPYLPLASNLSSPAQLVLLHLLMRSHLRVDRPTYLRRVGRPAPPQNMRTSCVGHQLVGRTE
ncbi:hypothetical protein HanRHA438_Chr03g0130161 [Helianthus annuus]|nr:hypothetical protein HanRHA438_Chr03g0130161 [Helianthus annuus]